MNEIRQGMKKLWPMLSFFYKYLTLRKVNLKVKVRFMGRQSEVLVAGSVVCKYERNLSMNEKVMSNVKVFFTIFTSYLTLRKVNMKVKVRFVCGSLKY